MHKQVTFLLLLLSILAISCKTTSPFEAKAKEGIQTSIQWKDSVTGIWETAGWWNSANVLTALIRYADLSGNTDLLPVIDDIFHRSKQYQTGTDSIGNARYCTNYINDYYDDEAWWALAWIDAYTLTKDQKYLDMAELIFDDLTTGWSEECKGGIYWKKNPLHYKNSIANNLFSLTAIRLYKSTQNPKYAEWFEQHVAWYMQTGMINTDIYQIEDGTDNDCNPNRNAHYTYNQGVAIAVLAEMYLHTNDQSYLDLSEKIAQATITTQLVTEEGILREMNPDVDKSNDGVQFKGIFIRHLGFLYEVTKNPLYKDFMIKNATSIITKNYDPQTKSFGHYWYGPFTEPNAAANASALECVIEAYALTK